MQDMFLFLLDELVNGGILKFQLILKLFVSSFQIIDGEIALFEDVFHHLSLEFDVWTNYFLKGLQRDGGIFESLHCVQ
jgi:hypothetical protein